MSGKSLHFIAAGGLVKIGVAGSVKRRLEAIPAVCPLPLTLIKSWRCTDAEKLEAELHNRWPFGIATTNDLRRRKANWKNSVPSWMARNNFAAKRPRWKRSAGNWMASERDYAG